MAAMSKEQYRQWLENDLYRGTQDRVGILEHRQIVARQRGAAFTKDSEMMALDEAQKEAARTLEARYAQYLAGEQASSPAQTAFNAYEQDVKSRLLPQIEKSILRYRDSGVVDEQIAEASRRAKGQLAKEYQQRGLSGGYGQDTALAGAQAQLSMQRSSMLEQRENYANELELQRANINRGLFQDQNSLQNADREYSLRLQQMDQQSNQFSTQLAWQKQQYEDAQQAAVYKGIGSLAMMGAGGVLLASGAGAPLGAGLMAGGASGFLGNSGSTAMSAGMNYQAPKSSGMEYDPMSDPTTRSLAPGGSYGRSAPVATNPGYQTPGSFYGQPSSYSMSNI